MVAESTWTRGYEDSYDGAGFAHAGELIEDLQTWCSPDSPVAALNVPVWIDVPEKMAGPDCEYCAEYGERVECSHRLSVGIMMPRKGRTIIKWTDAYAPEDVQAIRILMMRVWASRADVGFSRYSR